MSDFWSGFGGAALQTGGNVGTAFGLQSESQDFAEKLAKKAVRWRVKDLRAAGLNPILAANMGFGGGIPAGVSQGFAGTGDFTKGAKDVAQAASETDLRRYRKDLLAYQATAAEAQTTAARTLANLRQLEAQIMEPDRIRAGVETNMLNTATGRAWLKGQTANRLINETAATAKDTLNPFGQGKARITETHHYRVPGLPPSQR